MSGPPGKHGAPAPAMWVGALVSSVLGNILPGPGTVYHDQSLHFHGPSYCTICALSPWGKGKPGGATESTGS